MRIRRPASLIAIALTVLAGSTLPAAAASSTPGSSAGTTGSGSGTVAGNPAGRATFGIGPATLGKVDPRSYFSYVMGVGGIYSDQAAVLNYGVSPLQLTVFAADLGNNDTGGIAVGLQDQPSTDAGGWIQLPSKNVTVAVPGRSTSAPGRVVVPFRITVPKNASPGDHGAAIVAVLSTLGKNPKGENVRLDQRVASRIYLRVNGDLHPGLKIDGLTVSYRQSLNPLAGGTATVRYKVSNVGNVRLAAKQTVAVTGLFGTKAKVVAPADLQLLFPGASIEVVARVPGVWPALLEKSRVTVVPQLFQDQKPMPVPTASATANFTAIPWALLGVLALIVLLGALVWYLRRRARRRPSGGGRHGRGANGPPPPKPQLRPSQPETISS